MMKKIQVLLLLGALVFVVFLRFYNLHDNPPGLYWDEAAFGYDAYSMLLTGRDHHGVMSPLFFESFGDWKLPGYFYILLPSVAFFGLNEFSVRFPGALFGLMNVYIFYLLISFLSKNRRLAIFCAFMLGLSSWHIQFSRGGFESVPALFLFTLGLLLFLKGWGKRNLFLVIIAGILFSFTMYTYHAYRIFTPLFIGSFFIGDYKNLISKFKLLIVFFLLLVVMCLPLISFSMTGEGLRRAISESSFKDEDFQKARLDFDQRSKPPFRFLSGYLFNKPLYFGHIALKNYLEHFSPIFLFLRGDQIGRHSQVDLGQLHVFEALLLVIALLNIGKLGRLVTKIMVLWLILAPLPAVIVSPVPHAQRTLQMAIPFAFFSGYGLFLISQSKRLWLKLIFAVLVLTVFIFYAHYLFGHYRLKFSPDWQDGNKEMVEAVKKYQGSYEKVYISNSHNVPYIYLLFYLSYNPGKYLQFGSPAGFDKYSFVDPNAEIFDKGRALYVAPEWQNIEGTKFADIFDDFGRPVYRVWEIGGEKN